MERYQNSYEEALELNCENETRWTTYRKELVETRTNLQEFVKSRSMNIMVPMGKKAFVRGTLQHTNEITVSHGASLFSDVSSSQAIDILEHRIKNCDERLQAIQKEKELFTNKLKLPEDVFADTSEKEIIEEYNEESEKEWRRKHSESVRRQKQKEAEARRRKAESTDVNKILDDYEMFEELANELDEMNIDDDEQLAKLLNGSMKLPESKPRIAHNLNSATNGESEATVTEKKPPDDLTPITEINNNDLITQNNQEIVDLLKTYRCKIKDVLKNVKKDDERNVNLFLDLIELKDDIEDDIRKMNDDEVYSDSDERDSDDETTASIEVRTEETKRKVRFSESLEDVKLIESKSELLERTYSDNNTIEINFQHSSARFVSENNEDTIAHPGAIRKMFNKTPIKSLTVARKSILKNKGEPKSPEPLEEPPKKIFHTDVRIIGDVVEHKKEPDRIENAVHIHSKDDAPKKVSKFKQMRLKS